MSDANIPMFKEPLIDLDNNQCNLIFWCKFYNHNVFTLTELDRPSDFIVDYDILLDDWLEQKRFREEVKTRGVKQRTSTHDMAEVISFDT